jgi:hypothetical protein
LQMYIARHKRQRVQLFRWRHSALRVDRGLLRNWFVC